MTAVDPTRLAHDLTQALEHFDDPLQLTRRILDLLAFYADRTRRPAASTDSRDAPWAMEVAPAALRLMAPALRTRAAAQPASAFPAAGALWSTGIREAQALAAAIVGGLDSPYAIEWVEIRAESCRDEAVFSELAGNALAGIRRADPATLRRRQAVWLSTRSRRLHGLALTTLFESVNNCLSSEVPEILALLEGFPVPQRPELRRSYEMLLAALARRHPAETAHFMIAALQRPAAGMRRVAAAVAPAFPPPQRDQVEEALSA